MTRASLSARFGRVVRRIRTAQGLSQEKLAELSGLDRTFISMIERGTRRATLETAEQIARALSVPIAELIREACSED